MINITDKKDCCGCNACGDICSRNAITFITDIEGFWYPKVDAEKCNDCGLCEKTCPIINIQSLKKNDLGQSECHAAIHKNLEIRFDSTSGGVFSALAEKTYRDGGYVGGAIFNENFSVRHFISNDKKDLSALRSSKYLQSNALGFYTAVKDLLKQGEKVLVCGTPCQMSALRAFLRKDYENLIIVDFICRGINSPKVFRKYLDYLEDRFNSKVVYFKAKNKELGWRELTSKIVFENKEVLYDTKETSFFTIGYLQTGVYSRPSCYDCQFKGFPRIADITIADFWGAERVVGKELDNDLGTSLVMTNSQKGKKYYEQIQSTLLSKPITFDTIFKGNPALTKSLNLPVVDRKSFYEDLDKLPFKEVAEKYIKPLNNNPLTARRKIKNLLKFLFRVYKVSGLNIKTWYQNIKYNLFCKQIENKILAGHFIVINKHCVLDIKKGAEVVLNGIFTLGWKKFASSKLETRLLIENKAQLLIDSDFSVGYGSDIEIFKNAKLHIKGKGATNINATIICGEAITLGEYVMLGRNITIRDNNGNHYIARRGYKDTRSVVIGQHAWLCEGCTIIAGAKIGDGAIIGAKSLVANAVPAFTMVSGVPAVVVDEDVYWKY
ncbi:MAG: Coenzyme F420 hydrogenase/dehydrogenase, beta subunit C-terminal domain [Bacteroidetes bacterium]|nr:Coenzyme F420 hydrogenase/dehydrogenase, beta subunit C-terminal domain [Bacteroidota bacterium]